MTCTGCGVDTDAMMSELAEVRQRLNEVEDQLERKDAEQEELEGDNKRQRATIAHLKGELGKKRDVDPKISDARKVFAYHVTKLGKRKNYEFGPKRQAFLLEALKYFSVSDLCLAQDGLALRPFVGNAGRTGSAVGGARRFADIEHTLRDKKGNFDETVVKRFIGYAQASDENAETRRKLEVMGLDPDRPRSETFLATLMAAYELGVRKHGDGTVTINGENVRRFEVVTPGEQASLEAEIELANDAEDHALSEAA